MFDKKENATSTSAKDAPAPQPSRKLYSMAGLLRQGRFEGNFNAHGEKYRFTFAPREATISNRKPDCSRAARHNSDGEKSCSASGGYPGRNRRLTGSPPAHDGNHRGFHCVDGRPTTGAGKSS
jgi:hypothetical protein